MRAFCPVFEGWLGLNLEEHPFFAPQNPGQSPRQGPIEARLEGPIPGPF